MNPSIEEILRNHYVDGISCTHVSMIQPKGKFQLSRDGLKPFGILTVKKYKMTIMPWLESQKNLNLTCQFLPM